MRGEKIGREINAEPAKITPVLQFGNKNRD